MKKIFILVLCFTCFCGCKVKSPNVTAVTTGLSFSAEMLIDGVKYKYDTEILQDGSIKMAATEPENIKDLIISISQGKIKACYKGLEYNTDIGELPNGVVIDFLYCVFTDINSNNKKVSVKEDEFYIKGNTEKYDYTVAFGQSGLPLKIIDKSGIDIIIKNACIIKK